MKREAPKGEGDDKMGGRDKDVGLLINHALDKRAGFPIFLEWTRTRIQSKKILKVSDYSPSKNKNPRAYDTHAIRQVYPQGG